MKQLFSFFFFLMVISVTYGQFTVATHGGIPITDGSVFNFNQLGYTDATLDFQITNTGSENIDMRLQLVSMTNADDTGDWVCAFGACTPPTSQTEGTIFPLGNTSNSYTIIEPGVTTDQDDHMWNTDPGDGTNYPVEYEFMLYELNGNGDPITFYYRYDPDWVSVEDIAQVGFELYPNVSSDYINLEVDEKVSVQLINTQGQLIEKYNFESGSNIIDVSSYAKQLYYLKLRNKQGQQSLAKILVK